MDKIFRQQTKNRELTKAQFPIGCSVKIEYISDSGYEDFIGEIATVVNVDDASQVTCRLDNGRSARLCTYYGDIFNKV